MANEKKGKVKKEKHDLKTGSLPAAPLNVSSTSSKKEKKRKSGSASLPVKEVEPVAESPEPEAEPEPEPDVEKNGEANEWPKENDMELFQRIKKALPADDTMKYESRINHIDWQSIAFGEYTADDCKVRWLYVQGHLRRYRIVNELLEDAIAWRSRPWTNFNKGSKCQKHPEYPKKPLTSYMIFYMEKKDEILEKQPGLGMTDLSKVIAKLYNEMNDRKKGKYIEQAKKEKELFEIKLKKFMEDHPDYVPLKSEKFPMKAQPPKPPTPFKLYCDAKMPKFQNEGLNVNEAREKCRETFKDLNEKQKLKWIYKSVEQEGAYLEEMEKFKQEHPEIEVGIKKTLLSKDEKQLKDKTEGKPEKPPNSGYSLYSKKMLASSTLKHLESKERMTEISRMWKDLTEEERKTYNEEAQKLILSYKMEYASYLESLLPEQREAELLSSQPKGSKRAVSPSKKKAQHEEKKIKLDIEPQAVDSDSANEEEEDEDSSDDEEVNAKPSIQKPKSSLQMFCDSNLAKYKKKHPKMTQQELSRCMAKTFSKLSEEKKKMYENMAAKSKTEDTTKTKSSKGGSKSVKITVKPTPASSSVQATQERPSKSQKPSLNATPKSTAERPSKTKKTAASKASPKVDRPVWALKQRLFKNEPPKPPENLPCFYAYTILKDVTMSQKAMNERWEQLSHKQKKKHTTTHLLKQQKYKEEFESFVRSLPSEDLKTFRAIMKNRGKEDTSNDENEDEDDEDEEENNSSSEESASDEDSSD